MVRRGEFYDQDREGEKRRPFFYDQDASREQPTVDPEPPSAPSAPGPPVERWPRVPPPPPPPGSAPAVDPAPASPPVSAPPLVPNQAPARARPPAPPGDRAPRHRPPMPRPGPAPRHRRQRGRAAGPSMGQATAVLAFGTLASRVTGFLRVLTIAYVLGVGVVSDAFNYANGVPNIIYDLLLGGILSATLIPVFVEQLGQEDRRERSRSVSAMLTAIGLALIGISLLLWVIAPWMIRFYLVLNSESTGPAERSLATTLLRYFAPQVFFLGAIVASTALLNARRRFAVAAVSPVLNNLIAIAALLVTKFTASHVLSTAHASPGATLTGFAHDERAVVVLGAGTTAGYAVQLLVQVPAMHRLGLRLRPVVDFGHPAVRRVINLSSWLVGVVVANQASLALVMVLAGRTEGGVTAYQFSYQFFQLPYALVAVSVASAIMPDLSQRWSEGDLVAFQRQLINGMRVTLAVLIPLSFVYMAVAQPFIELAIHHGRVTQSGAHLVTDSLVLFAAGLPGFSAFFMLMRAYQAMQDARSMFGVYVFENVLTVVAAPILSALLGVPGLALAWAGPYTIAAVFAVGRLAPRVGSLGGWLTVRALMRILLASGVAVAVVVAIGIPLSHDHGDLLLVGRLVVQVAAGGAAYVYLARALQIRELRPVMAMVGRLTGRAG